MENNKDKCERPTALSDVNIDNYTPEVWSVQKDIIYAAIPAVESGLEYARECLTTHDSALGRTTHKNKTWAETMERDIRHMERTLEMLRACGPNAVGEVIRPRLTYAVVYTDNGPSGACGQDCVTTSAHTRVYVFDTEDEMREWLKANYDKMPKRKYSRVTCCFPKGDVANYSYNNWLEWPNSSV